jgi:hypothetical protein
MKCFNLLPFGEVGRGYKAGISWEWIKKLKRRKA